ncbi:1,2-dihydroxy-3-keto-5-methylthiopentene dioxygenase, partial [Coemansia biformis]
MRAYLHDNSDSDQHEAHDSGVEVSLEQLQGLRVEYMRLDGTHDERMEAVDELCKQRSYRSRDEINHWSTPEEEYEPKRKMFYTEHMHEDEEIRLVVEGSGFFDLRDKENRWVRILVEVGDLLILPGGIYHRFSMDKAGH